MKKIKVYIAFGEFLINAIMNHDRRFIEAQINDPDSFKVREFDTQAEANAYIQGLDDAYGWMGSAVLSPKDPLESKIIEQINNR